MSKVLIASATRPDPLGNLALYHNRLRNNYKGYYDQLARLQTERKGLEEIERKKVQLIAEAAGKTKTPFFAKQIGFDFSNEEVMQRFLHTKLGQAALAVLATPGLDDNTTFAFQERLRQTTNATAMA
jgi:YD repeat-containing protein